MEDTTHLTNEHSIKLFIQRDYSEGTAVKFQERFPSELDGRVIHISSHFELIVDEFRSIEMNLLESFVTLTKFLLMLKPYHAKHLWRIVVHV